MKTTEQNNMRVIVTTAFSSQDTKQSRVIPLLLSQNHQEVLEYKGGTLTVSLLNGLVSAPDNFTMWSLNRKQSGEPCPNCGESLTRRDETFFWVSRWYPAAVCAQCNLLWLVQGDNHLDAVDSDGSDTH